MIKHTLELPNSPNIFPVFHTSEIQPFRENNNERFPDRALHPPNPISINGQNEFFIDRIVDERKRGRGKQYRVRWQGEGPEGDKWLPASELEDCGEALEVWLKRADTNPPLQDESPTAQNKGNSK